MALIKAISGAFGFNDTLVYDNGVLLSDDEEALLQSQLSALSTKYDISLVVVTVDTLGDKTDEEYADDFYDYNDYKDDGALCLLVFSESNAKGENKLMFRQRKRVFRLFRTPTLTNIAKEFCNI